jgi:hypothetical protein
MTDHRPGQERLARVLARRHRSAFLGAMVVSVLCHVLAFLLWPDTMMLLDLLESEEVRTKLEPPQLVQLVRPDPLTTEEEAPLRVAVARIEIRKIPVSRPDLDRMSPVPAPDADLPPFRPLGGEPELAEPEQYNQPIARNILPDWKFPETLHGVVVTARAYVDARGKATGIVELVPPTEDERINREMVYLLRKLDYQPAYRNGQPVAEWAEVTFTFCGKSVRATSPAAPRDLVAPCADSDVVLAADSQ